MKDHAVLQEVFLASLKLKSLFCMEAKNHQNPLYVLNAWLQNSLTSTEQADTQESLKSRSTQLLFDQSPDQISLIFHLWMYSCEKWFLIFLKYNFL